MKSSALVIKYPCSPCCFENDSSSTKPTEDRLRHARGPVQPKFSNHFSLACLGNLPWHLCCCFFHRSHFNRIPQRKYFGKFDKFFFPEIWLHPSTKTNIPNIARTFHFIMDHFIAVKITAQLLHHVTLLFSLSQLANSVTYSYGTIAYML